MLDDTLLRAFLTLMATVAGIALVMMYIKRKTAKGTLGHSTVGIQVIARQALNPKAQIYIVSIGNKTVMLGVTEHSVTNLGELTQPQPATPARKNDIPLDSPTLVSFNGKNPLPTPNAPPPVVPLPQQPTFGNFLRSLIRRAA